MLEQQLAARFRAVVDDEPPFTLDPDELVDRLLRARRRWWQARGYRVTRRHHHRRHACLRQVAR